MPTSPKRRKDQRRNQGQASLAVTCALAVALSPGDTRAAVDAASEIFRTAPPHSDDGRLNPSQQDIELIVPAREQGPLGQVTIIIGADDSLRVKASDLVGVLGRVVTEDAASALALTADADGYITPTAAATLGYELRLDTALLELEVRIPLELRQRRSVSLGYFNVEKELAQPTDLPAPFSAYVTYRASLDYIHESLRAGDVGLQRPRVEIDTAGNIGPIAFENFLTYDGERENEFRRNASRLIYDDPGNLMRWTLGDLLPEGQSFQSAPDIAGLGVSRLYRLSPNDRLLTARANRTITLREASNVEIRINGVTSRTLRLQPGFYDLENLPLAQGANDVEIIVEGPSGAREVFVFQFFDDVSLLAPGIDEFYGAVGIRAPRETDGIQYLEDEPIFSGFYRRGLTEQLTAGANLQATRDAVLAGAEAVFGSAWGLVSVEASVSDGDDKGTGTALRTNFRNSWPVANLRGEQTFDASVELRSQDFSSIDVLSGGTNYPARLAARYSRPVTESLSASIGVSYAIGRDQLEDQYSVSATGNWRLGFDTNVTFGASYSSQSFLGENATAFVNLTRRFGARSTFSAGAETRNGLVRAGYSRAPERALDDWAWSVNGVRTDENFGFNGNAYYINNRGEYEVSHDTAFDDDGDIADQRTSARAFGSIAFAGGRVGVGRRIYDSFALVETHQSLGDRDVLIRGTNALEESARSGAFGPAVVSLGSYYPQEVPYDVEDLPVGYDLGLGVFQVRPRYHNGYSLTVGSSYFITAMGVLLNATGEPLSLRSGRAVSLDDPDAPSPEVITNRVGRFAVSGLAAGRWRLTFQGEPPLAYDIVVPAETLYRAGTLNPSGSGEQP